MPESTLDNIQYHTTELARAQTVITSILRQTYPPYNADGLSIEATYTTRFLLEKIHSDITLLAEAVEEHMNEPKKTLMQRILNK